MKASRGGCRIGVDVGGTFTDVVLHDPRSGALHVAKTLTTPGDLARAVMAGVDAVLAESGKQPSDVGALLHATTVATNAILERKGARTALLTTEGFRDVLILGRQKRYETYDLYFRKPAPLTRRRHVHEVRERVDADGNVVTPIDLESLDPVADRLLAEGIESAAIVFLHSYANPDHERAPRGASPNARPIWPSRCPATSPRASGSTSAAARPSPTPSSSRSWPGISTGCGRR